MCVFPKTSRELEPKITPFKKDVIFQTSIFCRFIVSFCVFFGVVRVWLSHLLSTSCLQNPYSKAHAWKHNSSFYNNLIFFQQLNPFLSFFVHFLGSLNFMSNESLAANGNIGWVGFLRATIWSSWKGFNPPNALSSWRVTLWFGRMFESSVVREFLGIATPEESWNSMEDIFSVQTLHGPNIVNNILTSKKAAKRRKRLEGFPPNRIPRIAFRP